jgi:hypothetical protein
MAMVHFLYVGHFVPDDGFVRFQQMRPVVGRPLDPAMLSNLLRQYLGSDSVDAIPADWEMSVSPEYIVCNRYGACSRALQFVAEYARRELASIVDLGSFTLISPEELSAEAAHLDHLQKERE